MLRRNDLILVLQQLLRDSSLPPLNSLLDRSAEEFAAVGVGAPCGVEAVGDARLGVIVLARAATVVAIVDIAARIVGRRGFVFGRERAVVELVSICLGFTAVPEGDEEGWRGAASVR